MKKKYKGPVHLWKNLTTTDYYKNIKSSMNYICVSMVGLIDCKKIASQVWLA